MMAVLLAAGAKIDVPSGVGLTPLMAAGNAASVEALCAAGADPVAVTNSGQTALMLAAGRGDQAAVSALIKAGAEVNASSDSGLTALHYAIQSTASARMVTVQALLDAGAEADEETDDGLTPLMGAAGAADPELVELLLEHGANVHARTSSGNSVVMFVCHEPGSVGRQFDRPGRAQACIRALVDAGADVNAANDSGETALMWAAYYANAILMRTLLEAGADPNGRDEDGHSALDFARRTEGLPGLADLLLEAGAVETGAEEAR
jgi:ankyrin repeat protein